MADIFTVDDLKMALLQVREICRRRTFCDGCPFDNEKSPFCLITNRPEEWNIDDWKEQNA